mgnify:CR=1 FL=1
MIMNEIESKCKELGCEHYIEWGFGCGNCISCKLQGESYSIDEVAEDCPHINEFKK